jgi:hypothetical protein
MSTIKNNKKYQAFLNLPERIKTSIEEQLIHTWAAYYNSGYSAAYSIAKTSKTLGKSRGLVEKVVRNNPVIKELLVVHRREQLDAPWGLR